MDRLTSPAPFLQRLQAPGTAHAPYIDLLAVADLPAGTMRRASVGEVDVLLAHTDDGIVATEDRCPHMSAPLSLGELDGCIVACPLHDGRFDLRSGDPAQMPTTGGMDPDGVYHPTWTPGDRPDKPDVPGKKAEARRLTRVRRFQYFPVAIRDGRILVALPVGGAVDEAHQAARPPY